MNWETLQFLISSDVNFTFWVLDRKVTCQRLVWNQNYDILDDTPDNDVLDVDKMLILMITVIINRKTIMIMIKWYIGYKDYVDYSDDGQIIMIFQMIFLGKKRFINEILDFLPNMSSGCNKSYIFPGAPSGLRLFFAIESPLKWWKKLFISP